MKVAIIPKVFFLIGLITISFKYLPDGSRNHPKPSKKAQISLNGIDEKIAEAMTYHFAQVKNQDKHPLAASIWFSKKEIHEIVTLLDKEKYYPESPSSIKPDGLRIYFACDTFASRPPFNTFVILVATTDNGPSGLSPIVCPSQRNHKDYYEHDAGARLFNMGYTRGEVCYGKARCEGNKLYNFGIYLDDPKCPPTPHHIRTQLARHMVATFENHVINTVSEWFDLATFERIDRDATPSGIHLYFATHPFSFTKKGKPFSKRDGFVIVPTKWNARTHTDEDYFDCKTDNYFNVFGTVQITTLDFLMANGGQGQDEGELCPDNCNK
jgi:hypothetical protein